RSRTSPWSRTSWAPPPRRAASAAANRAAKVAARAESFALRRATLVGIIHETFRAKVEALGVAPERVRLVPNWSHVTSPTGDREATRARLGWAPGETVVVHSGNMGLKQGPRSPRRVRPPRPRRPLRAHGRRQPARPPRRTRAGGVPNLDFLPPADDADFMDVLAAADVLAVTQRASVLDMSVPSKLTSYFAAARPVIASVAAEGGTAHEVLRSGAGLLVAPEDPDALLKEVRRLADDPARARALGDAGPRHVAAHLTRAAGLARIDALIEEALGVWRT
ncbi:LOW QUALITY PROTEIN: glycosyl transferase, partial [Streptomyces sp. SPB78]